MSEKPILDEQQMDEIGFALQRSLSDGLPVEIKCHNGFDFSYTKVKVLSMDKSTKKVIGLDIKNKLNIDFKFDDIYDITF